MARIKLLAFFAAVTGCFGQIESNAPAIGKATLHQLVAAICPGHAQWSPTASGCSVCPNETSMVGHEVWDIQTIFLGHYLSGSSRDAFVTGMGCEPHAEGRGGSFLLTHAGNSWRKVHYVAGTGAYDCRQLPGSDGHDRLVCADEDGHQGHFGWFLFLLDPGRNQRNQFFDVTDDTGAGACQSYSDDTGEGEYQSGSIDRVDFISLRSRHQVRIVVYGSSGSMSISPTFREQVCSGEAPEPDITPLIKPTRDEFLFDGTKITLVTKP